MHYCKTIFSTALFISLQYGGLAAAADAFEDKVDKAVAAFSSKRDSRRDQIAKAIDVKLAELKRVSPNANLRAEQERRLIAARTRFVTTGSFPEDGSLVDLERAYFGQLQADFSAISKLFEREITSLSNAGDFATAQRRVLHRQAVEKQLLDSDPLVAGTVWRGTLTRKSGATIPFALHIEKVSPTGVFEGRVEDNAGVPGNWRYHIAGQTSGIKFTYAMTQNLRGGFTAVNADGHIIGNKLVARLDQYQQRRVDVAWISLTLSQPHK